MPAKFVLKKGSTGKFRFNLLAPNGQVIATSEAYESKRAAMNGINSVKKSSGDADIDDQTAGAAKKTTAAKESPTKKSAPAKKQSAKKQSAKKTSAKKSSPPKKQSANKNGAAPEPEEDTLDRPTGEEAIEAGHVNLGPCHYNQEEEAVVTAARADGTGWIAVCDDHRQQAEEEGFEIAAGDQPSGE